MADVLATVSDDGVAAWYGRLANFVSKELRDKLQGVEPLSAQLLRHWLLKTPGSKSNDNTFRFKPPMHLRTSKYVKEQLSYHRRVYLTEEKARVGPATMVGGVKLLQETKWAGVIPRLQGKSGFTKWNGKTALSMEYWGNCEIPLSVQKSGSAGDRDLLYALHGFKLKTRVNVQATPIANSAKLSLSFNSWWAKVLDTYDWSVVKHIKVPNPDYGSASPGAVAPGARLVDVHHTNAARIQKRGLAKPFKVESEEWAPADWGVIGPAEVDPDTSL